MALFGIADAQNVKRYTDMAPKYHRDVVVIIPKIRNTGLDTAQSERRTTENDDERPFGSQTRRADTAGRRPTRENIRVAVRNLLTFKRDYRVIREFE